MQGCLNDSIIQKNWNVPWIQGKFYLTWCLAFTQHMSKPWAETDSVAWRPAPAECSLNEAQASSDSWFYFRSPSWLKKRYRMDLGERLSGRGRAFFSVEVANMPLTLCHSSLTYAVGDTVWGGERWQVLLSPAWWLKQLCCKVTLGYHMTLHKYWGDSIQRIASIRWMYRPLHL